MCGRSACSRGPRGVACACAYRNRNDVISEPQWALTEGKSYWPSYNISPHTYTPVLVSASHRHLAQFGCSGDSSDWVLQPMRWGLVPNWHKGDPSSFSTILNNCRSETMREKPSFRSAISRGQRCVVLADGFYEWQTFKPGKQPYFITFANDALTKETVELCESIKDLTWDEDTKASSFKDKRLLTMAGYFDIWKSSSKDTEDLYTYTVITVEAKPPFSNIHHRMPAILDGSDAVSQWLDHERVSADEAASLIHPADCLKWYPVSTVVNNVRNKSPDCVKEIDLSKSIVEQLPPSQPSLFKWMKKKPLQLKDECADGMPPVKKEKK